MRVAIGLLLRAPPTDLVESSDLDSMSQTPSGLSDLRSVTLLLLLMMLKIPGASLLAQSVPPSSGVVEKRVEAILSRMTPEEKLDILGGVDDFFIRAYPPLGLPRLRMADGPLGVRNASPPATAMAAGISLAASWDPKLAERVGREIGRDARARGVHFMLGPAVNLSLIHI